MPQNIHNTNTIITMYQHIDNDISYDILPSLFIAIVTCYTATGKLIPWYDIMHM